MKVFFITGNRSEYGLLKRLIKLVINEKFIESFLFATGDHLNSVTKTISEIKNDSIEINGKIECSPEYDSPLEILKSMGSATIELANHLDKIKPDVIIILGDRYEMLVVAITSLILKIPLLHISGGEVTEGSLDDTIRHSITKFADYHFVAIEEFKKRVIQLGESPNRIKVVGGMGIDSIENLNLFDSDTVFKKLKIKNPKLPIILFTYHPNTAEKNTLEECISILNALSILKDVNIILTYPNSDFERDKIIHKIKLFALKKENTYLFTSLGQLLYLSTLRISSCIIGNSSSGITEAPYFGVTTINIGSRQKGRPRCPSIIDLKANSDLIYREIKNSLKRKKTKYMIYGKPGASKKILDFLKINKGNFSKKKGFNDIKFS